MNNNELRFSRQRMTSRRRRRIFNKNSVRDLRIYFFAHQEPTRGELTLQEPCLIPARCWTTYSKPDTPCNNNSNRPSLPPPAFLLRPSSPRTSVGWGRGEAWPEGQDLILMPGQQPSLPNSRASSLPERPWVLSILLHSPLKVGLDWCYLAADQLGVSSLDVLSVLLYLLAFWSDGLLFMRVTRYLYASVSIY